MSQITVRKGRTQLKEYILSDKDIVLIGRAGTNDILLPDPNRKVSRYHAAIIRIPASHGLYFVRDLSSPHSTMVRGEPVQRKVLEEGDIIQIADYDLIYSAQTRPRVNVSRLRVVHRKADTGFEKGSTFSFAKADLTAESGSPVERRELLEELLQKSRRVGTLREIFDDLMGPLGHVLEADRGFIGLFSGNRKDFFDETGVFGLGHEDEIDVSSESLLDRILEGQYVRDGTTLLVPIFRGDEVIGFFCLDRRPPSKQFSPEDANFLISLGRVATSELKEITIVEVKSAISEEELEWPVDMVGKCKAMQDLFRKIHEAASSGMNVLILGESGTGKELVAKALHQASIQSKGPFIPRNCGQTTETLAETEIFGYAPKSGIADSDPQGVPGWFEIANGGTLFLDEIQTLSPSMQDKFLRVLQGNEVWRAGARSPIRVNVRVLAATDEDLEAALERGELRKPFYYRFGIRMQVPSLRERKEDIPLLAHYFLDKYAKKLTARTRSFSHQAMRELLQYDWPGNVRELENIIQKAISRSKDKEILFSWDLKDEIRRPPSKARVEGGGEAVEYPERAGRPQPKVPLTMEQIEKEKIMEALEATRGNIAQAGGLLGFKSRQTMLNKMDKYGIARNYGDDREST